MSVDRSVKRVELENTNQRQVLIDELLERAIKITIFTELYSEILFT